MKKTILNLGKVLSKTQQKSINGGRYTECNSDSDCPNNMSCCYFSLYKTEICAFKQFC